MTETDLYLKFFRSGAQEKAQQHPQAQEEGEIREGIHQESTYQVIRKLPSEQLLGSLHG